METKRTKTEVENAKQQAFEAQKATRQGKRNGGARKATATEYSISGRGLRTIRGGGGGGLCLLAVLCRTEMVVGEGGSGGDSRQKWANLDAIYGLNAQNWQYDKSGKRKGPKGVPKRSRPAGDNSVREMNIRY